MITLAQIKQSLKDILEPEVECTACHKIGRWAFTDILLSDPLTPTTPMCPVCIDKIDNG